MVKYCLCKGLRCLSVNINIRSLYTLIRVKFTLLFTYIENHSNILKLKVFGLVWFWFGFGLVSFKSYVSKITGMKAFLSDLDNNDGTTDSGIYKPQLLNLILGYLHAGARVQVLKNRSVAFCHPQITPCYHVPHYPYLYSL